MSANNQNLPLSKRESTINGDDDRSKSDSFEDSELDQSYSLKNENFK